VPRDVSYSSQPIHISDESCPFRGGESTAPSYILRRCTCERSERVASAQFGWLIHARISFLRPIGTRLMMGAATRTKASSALLEGNRQ
jgi:hypothetical protein